MAEALRIISGNKEQVYEALRPQVEALLQGETDSIANMANLVAALKEAFNFFWVGYYRVQNDVLVLGPFQGPIACTRIKYGKGVCGTAWKEAQTLVVPNVEEFPGHISCNSRSKSEIVVPVFNTQ
jgi:GAF domain-containing protein